jgi:DNA-binding LacI/PurR family transcriptional regulator
VLLAPEGEWTPDSGYACGLRGLEDRDVTAVFAANDEMAIGLMAAASALGLDVPRDLSVVGFDDIPSARYLSPPLTTVQQDFAELGRRAIATLLDEIEHGAPQQRHPALTSRLVVRSSTAEVTIGYGRARAG